MFAYKLFNLIKNGFVIAVLLRPVKLAEVTENIFSAFIASDFCAVFGKRF